MTPADRPKEASMLKIAGHNSSFQIIWHTTLQNLRLQMAFWKNYITLTKSLMFQIDPLNSSCS